MKFRFFLFVIGFVAFSLNTYAQTLVLDTNVRSIKLYRPGDQTSFPVIALNGSDVLELDFDDITTRVKNYYYTFQLCNADWSPSILHPFEYIKGFETNRITTFRNSSLAAVQYVHYQAIVPDRNCYPTKSGNYLLKVFLDNDTSKLVFAKRFVVADNVAAVRAVIQQPFNASLFNVAQKLAITLQTDPRIHVLSPSDIKVVALQNNNWQTSLFLDQPTIYRGNYYEYSDEAITAMLGQKEFRWLDLRTFQLKSDRMQVLENRKDSVKVYLKTDVQRGSEGYIYYRDQNGAYTIETIESVNPFWQTDYAYVYFSYMPPGGRPIEGNNLYIFGELTNYNADENSKMVFNAEKGVYEKTLLLKEGFYNYLYATKPAGSNGPLNFDQTEGSYWGTENNYTILVYYRPFGARADELIGYNVINSTFQR